MIKEAEKAAKIKQDKVKVLYSKLTSIQKTLNDLDNDT